MTMSDPVAAAERPLFPPWKVRLLAAASLVYAVIMRNLEWPDGTWGNIQALVGTFVAIVYLLAWFVLQSGYSRRARIAVPAVLGAIVLVLVAAFRVEGTSGNLVPRWRLRWARAPDQLLAKAAPQVRPGEPAKARADLSRESADDYPGFLGRDRRATLPDVKLEHNWDARPPKLLWKEPIGAGWSAFAVVGGYAVTMEQRDQEELVTCRELLTGKLVWVHGITARHDSVLGGVGPRSTPTIHAGRVYALGATGVLRCLAGEDGSLIWQHDLLAMQGTDAVDDMTRIPWGRAASPLVVDDKVVVPVGGPLENLVSLAAFDLQTGKRVWRGGKRQVAFASPELATLDGMRQIAIVNEDTVTGHDPASGAELWSFDWPGSSSADANVSQCFQVGPDRMFVSKGYGGGSATFRVFRAPSGAWKTEPLAASRRALRTKLTNVVVKNGYAYGLSDGILECVRIDDLVSQWKRGRYGHGQTMLVGDLLLIVGEGGEVALVAATPERYQELARFQALEGNTWNNPALVGKHLLVRNALEAACYELP
jgi:hypothetical protein